jgi:hypothetical protein
VSEEDDFGRPVRTGFGGRPAVRTGWKNEVIMFIFGSESAASSPFCLLVGRPPAISIQKF